MGYIDTFRLSGKVAIVTGGSRGLGRAIAIGYGEAGAKVVVVSRSKDIEETAHEITKRGGDAMALPLDITEERNIKTMINMSIDEFGRLDIVVNNAAIAHMNKAIDMSVEEWDTVLDTNLRATFLICKAAGEKMIKQKKGKIINIGSVLGMRAANMAVHYCSSKGAIVQLTKALALEWARYNINVNCLAPGYLATEMVQAQQDDEKHSKFLHSKIPFRRFAKPEEIVGTAIFLASEASDYMTGSVVVIDGGYSIW